MSTRFLPGNNGTRMADTHVSLVVVFTVPEDKMEKFVNNFGEFYNKTKGGSEECVYYGFATSGNKVIVLL